MTRQRQNFQLVGVHDAAQRNNLRRHTDEGHDMSDVETRNDLDSGHYFELLDRTHVATRYLEVALGEHPVLTHNPDLMALYEAALDRLQVLYQAVGQREVTWK